MKRNAILVLCLVVCLVLTACANSNVTETKADGSQISSANPISEVAEKPADTGNHHSEPVDEDCPFCYGLGICSKCKGDGDCGYCFGRGGEYCGHCSGGRCINCGGSGEVYASFGLDAKKVRCSYCNGGRCRYCGGTGQKKCSICYGTGHCSLCHGSGKCQYCYGTGKK